MTMAGISIGPVGGGGFCTQIVCGAENSGTVMVERMGQCRLSELLGYAQEALVFGGVSMPRNGVTLNYHCYQNPTHNLFHY